MGRRALIAVVLTLALVVGAGGVFYAFGTPEQQSSPIASTSTAPAASDVELAAPAVPAVKEAETSAEAKPAVPAPDPASPLAIEIPGCRCHSDDPQLVKEHEGYRMNQCAGCHAGGVPTGQ